MRYAAKNVDMTARYKLRVGSFTLVEHKAFWNYFSLSRLDKNYHILIYLGIKVIVEFKSFPVALNTFLIIKNVFIQVSAWHSWENLLRCFHCIFKKKEWEENFGKEYCMICRTALWDVVWKIYAMFSYLNLALLLFYKMIESSPFVILDY